MSYLKPCPFCGGAAYMYSNNGRYGTFGYIACECCGAETRKKKLRTNYTSNDEFFNQPAFDDLTAIWNQRCGKCQTD